MSSSHEYSDSQCAYRYRQIHSAVEQMGGWANFSHWILHHSAQYFETCEILGNERDALQAKIVELNKQLKSSQQALGDYGWHLQDVCDASCYFDRFCACGFSDKLKSILSKEKKNV